MQSVDKTNNIHNLSSTKKILLVEDNLINLKLMTDLLLRYEYQIISARNGQEAIDLAKIEKPDIILMDIKMPVMDGLKAIKILREMPEFKTLPIIAITALSGDESKNEQLAAGFNDHLSKPIKFDEVLGVINKYLSIEQ